jgi:hypothetical protein
MWFRGMTETNGMVHRVTFFRVWMLATSTLTKVQQAADSPRNLTGAFRSHGRDGTHGAETKGVPRLVSSLERSH